MLELLTTPLIGATLLLLFFICIWWFIVEWSFSKPSTNTHTAATADCTTVNAATDIAAEKHADQKPQREESLKAGNSKPAPSNPQNLLKSAAIAGNAADAPNTNSTDTRHSTITKSATEIGCIDSKPTSDKANKPDLIPRTENTVSKSQQHKSIADSSESVHRASSAHASRGAQPNIHSRESLNTARSTTTSTSITSSQVETAKLNTGDPTREPASQVRTLAAIEGASQQQTTPNTHAKNVSSSAAKKLPEASSKDAKKNSKPDNYTSQDSTGKTRVNHTQAQKPAPQPDRSATHSPGMTIVGESKADTDKTDKQNALTKISTDGAKTQPDKTTNATHPQKYQTAAKAKHHSSQSEASLQIPAPSLKIDNQLTDSVKKEKHSDNTNPNKLNKKLNLATSALQTKQEQNQADKSAEQKTTSNIQSIKLATDNARQPGSKTEKNIASSSPAPFRKHQSHSTTRKQSPIEAAVDQQASAKSTRQNIAATGINISTRQTISSDETKSGNAVETINKHNADSSAPDIKSTVSEDVADCDAALRAQLASSERKLKTLQSTLSNLQHNLPAVTKTTTHTSQQHSRPTLLSKVRVLDHPKS